MINNNIKDKAAKNLQVQQYVWAMINWLADHSRLIFEEKAEQDQLNMISSRLGEKSGEKEPYVRIIIAHLTYDFSSFKKLRLQVSNKKFVSKVEQIDVYGIDFQKQIDPLISSIGKMEFGQKLTVTAQVESEKTSAEYEFNTINHHLILKTRPDGYSEMQMKKAVNSWLAWKTSRHLQLHYSFSDFLLA